MTRALILHWATLPLVAVVALASAFYAPTLAVILALAVFTLSIVRRRWIREQA